MLRTADETEQMWVAAQFLRDSNKSQVMPKLFRFRIGYVAVGASYHRPLAEGLADCLYVPLSPDS